jgi:transcription elongation factor Elf1
MSLIIDRQYVFLISTKLRNFTQKNPYLWNFSCPLCGDSRKNKLKARGYVYRQKSNLSYICHNCGSSMSFGNLVKSIDPVLYSQYQLDRYKEESHSGVKAPDFTWAKEKPVFAKKTLSLPTLASLSDDNPGKKYALSRKIPRLDELFYAEDFKAFALAMFPSTSSGIKKLYENDQRIVIPFYDEDMILQGVQGRTVADSKIRYITLKMHEDAKKIFGLHRIDFSKPIYVVEGPIDSLFLDNAIATMDSSLHSVIQSVGDHDYVFVFDNEKRNKEIVKQMSRAIDTGKKVCIWTDETEGKDINDMILSGMTSKQIKSLIDTNTFSDLSAKLRFQQWKKVSE